MSQLSSCMRPVQFSALSKKILFRINNNVTLNYKLVLNIKYLVLNIKHLFTDSCNSSSKRSLTMADDSFQLSITQISKSIHTV